VVTDQDGRIVDTEADILEIITPNHDGAEDNAFPGWPGMSYITRTMTATARWTA